ncbi:hypothetical protein Q8A73_021852 [Channa argus]|nr:hypothetical protein Q8A73_021852 [Channa argus]
MIRVTGDNGGRDSCLYPGQCHCQEQKMWGVHGGQLTPSILPPSLTQLPPFSDQRGPDGEINDEGGKTGSEAEAVSHGDICVYVSDTNSDVPYTKLSAPWTFLTIYVGQGQDRLNRSASLSPYR